MSKDEGTHGIKDLGRRLAQIRKSKKVTQAELSERLNVDPFSISRWETGSRTPDLNTVLRLAEALKVGLDAIVGPSYGPGLDPNAQREVELIHMWRRMDVQDQNIVCALMQRLLQEEMVQNKEPLTTEPEDGSN